MHGLYCKTQVSQWQNVQGHSPKAEELKFNPRHVTSYNLYLFVFQLVFVFQQFHSLSFNVPLAAWMSFLQQQHPTGIWITGKYFEVL